MNSEPDSPVTRKDELKRRHADIHARIEELQEERADADESFHSRLAASATHQAELSRAAAERAITSGVSAYLKAAEVHDRAADLHERAAASERSNTAYHKDRAAFHRAAAAADRERAEQFESTRPRGRRG